MNIKFNNFYMVFLFVFMLALFSDLSADGFTLLFDGKTMDQWRNYKSKGIKSKWQVIDNCMVLTEKGGRDIITKEKFDYFDLHLEYTIEEKGNSGVMFRVIEEVEDKHPWKHAPEFQLYDSYNVKVREDRCAGALYGLIGAPKYLARKPGEWNQVRILLEPGKNNTEHLQGWLNGTKTIDVIIDHTPDSDWLKLIEGSKSKDHFAPNFFKAKTGHILLQDHGNRTSFRNIKIKKIK